MKGGMSHEYRIKQLRAAIRLPGNSQKSYKFFCRGLDIRVSEIMEANFSQPVFAKNYFKMLGEITRLQEISNFVYVDVTLVIKIIG